MSNRPLLEEVPEYEGPPLDEIQQAVICVMFRLAKGRAGVSIARSELVPEVLRYMRLTHEEKCAYEDESDRLAEKERS